MYQFFHNAAAYFARRNMLHAKPKAFEEKRQEVQDEPLFENALDVCLLNNHDWFRHIHVLEFLSDVGRYARVSDMLARDSVKSRMTSENGAASGLSFTEFSYQLMQAYDFNFLHEKKACSVQLGGSDQMGNIMAGIDLIRRRRAALHSPQEGADDSMRADPAYGLTLPLLTTSTGAKFGKSAGNAVWLSRSMLSDFDFYQYFIRTADADVERYLKSLTFMSEVGIAEVMAEHAKHKSKRIAQTRLADEMTELVRGYEALERARLATKLLFATDVKELTLDQVMFAFKDDPRLVHVDDPTPGVLRLAADVGLVPSRSDARRLVKPSGGGLYINDMPVKDVRATIKRIQMREGRFIVLRAGKSNRKIVVFPPMQN